MVTPVDHDDITPTGTATWEDVDLTSNFGGDAGSVAGIICLVKSTSGSPDWGARTNGSTDALLGEVQGSGIAYFGVGVDSGDIVELYRADSNVSFYLLAYMTDTEAEFLTNSVDKSLTTTGSWEDVDVSANFTDTAQMVFMHVQNASGSITNYNVRENGSTDNRGRVNFQDASLQGCMISVDGSEIFEANINPDADTDFFLQGGITDSNAFSSFTNMVDYSENTTTGSFVDVDFSSNLSATSNGAFVQFLSSDSSTYDVGIRKNGTAHNHAEDANNWTMAWSEVDGSQVAEQYVGNTAMDTWLWGETLPGVTDVTETGTMVSVTVDVIDTDDSEPNILRWESTIDWDNATSEENVTHTADDIEISSGQLQGKLTGADKTLHTS